MKQVYTHCRKKLYLQEMHYSKAQQLATNIPPEREPKSFALVCLGRKAKGYDLKLAIFYAKSRETDTK